MSLTYQIIRRKVPVLRTDHWNPRTVEEQSAWIEGPGVNRPATDVEIAICDALVERAVAVVRPFSEFLNVTAIGGTPEDALRKEFGL